MTAYRIAVTDDEDLFRKGLTRILSDVDGFQVLLNARHGRDLLDKFEGREELPDLVLLDLQMPEMDGVDTLRALNKAYPALKVVILTSHYNATLILKMIELGASAFLAKNTPPEELIATIRNVVDNGFHYDSFTVKLLWERTQGHRPPAEDGDKALTKREREVLELIGQQYTNKEIADELHISPRTVEGHRNRMLEKTGSKNTVGLILYAIERGIVELENVPKKSA